MLAHSAALTACGAFLIGAIAWPAAISAGVATPYSSIISSSVLVHSP